MWLMEPFQTYQKFTIKLLFSSLSTKYIFSQLLWIPKRKLIFISHSFWRSLHGTLKCFRIFLLLLIFFFFMFSRMSGFWNLSQMRLYFFKVTNNENRKNSLAETFLILRKYLILKILFSSFSGITKIEIADYVS